MDLTWSREQQVTTTYNSGDTLKGIIGHHSQLIGIEAISPAYNKITYILFQILPEPAMNHVWKADYSTICHHSQGFGVACRLQVSAAGTWIDDAFLALTPGRLDLFPAATAWICQPDGNQVIGHISVDFDATTLV